MPVRRELIKRLTLASFLPFIPAPLVAKGGILSSSYEQSPSPLKISLNAYSFNDSLRSGKMDLEGLLDFCARENFDAADLTGYYFPGYPSVPPDKYIYQLKRKAHLLGLDISGTGVRNDFTEPDALKRKQDVDHVKAWIEVASKLGAPVIRIFSGTQSPAGHSREAIETWMIKDIRECVKHGEEHGVIVAMQNHNDFVKTGDQALSILKKIDSEWFGLVLDIGSYQQGDPYQQIAATAPFAVNWQIKENMFINGIEQKTDLSRIFPLIRSSKYRGYLPIETLGAGDPLQKVPAFLRQVRAALGNLAAT